MTVDNPSNLDDQQPTPDTEELAALLADWLPRQRWFAGRGELARVTISSRAEIAVADHGAAQPDAAGQAPSELVRYEHLLIEVPADDGPRRYQLWLGFRERLPDRLAHSEIGILGRPPLRAAVVYDALADQVLSSLLLAAIADGSALGDVHTSLSADTQVDVDALGLVISGEQSNTSIVYGDSAILKLFRRLEPGPNPDAEVHAALAQRSSTHVAKLLGQLSTEVAGVPTTLGVLTQYFANSADGWLMATASVRDLMAEGDLRADEVGGDFASESYRLGEAVAELHRDLAAAFGTSTVHQDELRQTLDEMMALAKRTIAIVPQLAEHGDRIMATFADAASSAASLTLQRIHGDLHLGQTLRTLTGWAVIDFEGEPSKPLAYRRAMHSPLRDLAGMLRSFDYAGHHSLAGSQPDAQHTFRAAEWAARNRRAFCDGYAATAGSDPRHAGSLLRAFELDKAVYEVRYEHDHRPTWLPIPLQAVAQLTRPGGTS